MKLQIQPSFWSCIPTAFAMLFGVEVHTLIEKIGHDGSEILWPALPYPHSCRGFHPQECIDLAIEWEIPIVEVHVLPTTIHFIKGQDEKAIWTEDYCLERFYKLLNNYQGVLGGRTGYNSGHAVAWNGSRVYDPRGCIKRLSEANFNPQIFYLNLRSKSNYPAI